MLTYIFAIIAGFALLVWGADRFVTGAAATARNLGVSPLVIGLTIVGFGTSAPEILISIVAAIEDNVGIAIGNAIGSNIANIALILGITALIAPLDVHSDTLKREFPILLAVTLVTFLLLNDGHLGRIDGVVLLGSLATILIWMVQIGRRSRRNDPMPAEYAEEIPSELPTKKALLWMLLGLAVLIASSRLLVWGAVAIAQLAGVSELVIGLTIVAIGTSLPELAASLVSAVKNEHDIAIGNILGSNMYNLLAVLAVPGLIRPGPFGAEVLDRDFPIMIFLTLVLFIMAYGFRKPGRITRPEGAALLTGFILYQGLLYFSEAA